MFDALCYACARSSLINRSSAAARSTTQVRSRASDSNISSAASVEYSPQPRDHLCLVMLLIGILPRTHAVAASLDRDDVAASSHLPHRLTQNRGLLVGNLIVAGAVYGQEGRHAFVHRINRRDVLQL